MQNLAWISTTPNDNVVYMVIKGSFHSAEPENGKETVGIGLKHLAACFNLDPNEALLVRLHR